jgi:hypothetical protein
VDALGCIADQVYAEGYRQGAHDQAFALEVMNATELHAIADDLSRVARRRRADLTSPPQFRPVDWPDTPVRVPGEPWERWRGRVVAFRAGRRRGGAA